MGKKLSSFFLAAQDAGKGADNAYGKILEKVRQYVSEKYAEAIQATLDDVGAKKALWNIVLQCLAAQEITYRDYTPEDLADRLVGDMAGFGFLEPLLYDDRVEEIRGNSWDDIEVVYAGQKAVKYTEHFRDPQHASDTIKKMVRLGGYQLDESTPDVDSYFTRGIRISAWIAPVVDSDVGVAFVIRRQRTIKITREELLAEKTADGKELLFLEACLKYGVSIVIAGETGSGKTTLLEYLLSLLVEDKDDQRRILTMEENRELNLVQRDADGKVISSVIHTRTRETQDPRYAISQNQLLKRFMRFTPKVIAVAEMRGEEAYTALSSAMSGHAVITSIHAGSVDKAIEKIMMYSRESEISRGFADDDLRRKICKAFPVICYIRQLEDESRKIMQIVELESYGGGMPDLRVLFAYDSAEDCHKTLQEPSDSLKQMILEKGGTV